ncbi:apolipoprotein A-II [Xyrichtys novacula]|uniref:Apolipoprotein A-II n=1 Tax=Xyrichtys novacula TaxID=13765 RepID=A0AAV1FNX7_XYRNO|nr:apolipoprotein A-II [Xyrichtys novacula]
MNAKYAVALILALQVSMSLCEVPQPSQELVDKYNELKATFMKRIMNVANKIQTAAGPMVAQAGQLEQAGPVREYVEDLQNRPGFQAFVAFATGMADEARPLVDKARTALLGMYEEHLRPKYGEGLNEAINQIKVFLDKYMPTE